MTIKFESRFARSISEHPFALHASNSNMAEFQQ
jgi:hypothetical protein